MRHRLSLVAIVGLSLASCSRPSPEPESAASSPANTPAVATPPPAAPEPAPTPPPASPSTPVEAAPTAPPAAEISPELLDPSRWTEQAPDRYTVELDTTEGTIELVVHRAWAPRGADRFWNLVKAGYFTDVAFFRVIAGFMAQVGIHGDGRVNAAWRQANIEDDRVVESNTRGRVSFATAGPNTRTTQFFINFGDNRMLDGMGFAPFAEVRNMDVVDRLFSGYGEGAPQGRGPLQGRLQSEGNTYLRASFPELDYIRSARVTHTESGRGGRSGFGASKAPRRAGGK